MKYLLMVASLISALSFAENIDSFEFSFGAITEHLQNSNGDKAFKTPLAEHNRLIWNPLYGMRFISENKDDYLAITGFVGANSIGKDMEGAIGNYGWKFLSQHLYVGGVAGAYLQNDNYFYAVGDKPTKLYEFSNGRGVIPVLGIEIDIRQNLNEHWYIKLDNIITPLLTTSSLSIGESF